MRLAQTRPAWPLAALALLAALGYLRPLLLGKTFAVRDHLQLVLPARTHLASSLAAGRLPEWWDGVGLGIPFAADPNNQVTYPVAWLLALAPGDVGADLLLLVHVFLAGVGTYLLARRLGASPGAAVAGGAAFMLSGYTSSVVVNGNPVFTLAWTPFVVFAAEGLATADGTRERLRAGLGFAAFFALALMAGNPSGLIIAALLALLWCLVRAQRGRRLWILLDLGLATAAALALSAFAILPGLQLLAESGRREGIGFDDATVWSMHPRRAAEWIWPFALGHLLRGERGLGLLYADTGGTLEPVWAGSLFVGLPVLLLAAGAGRRHAAWLGVSAAFVVLALGRFTPIYRVFRWVFPPETFVRYPEKFFVSAVLLWSVAAAVGLSRALAEGPRRRLTGVAMAAAAILAAASGVLALIRGPLARWLETEAHAQRVPLDAPGAVDAMLSGGVVAMLGGILLAAALWACRRPRLTRLAPVLAIASIAAPLLAHTWALLPVVDRRAVARPPDLLAPAGAPAPGRPPERVLRRVGNQVPPGSSAEEYALLLHNTSIPNTAARFGFADFPGFNPAETERSQRFAAASRNRDLEWVLDLLDIRFVIQPLGEGARSRMVPRGPAGAENQLFENTERRPRAFLSTNWTWHDSDSSALHDLFGATADPTALRLAGQGASPPPGGGRILECEVATPRPERVVIDCDSRSGGYVAYLMETAPGWSATVDGAPAQLERADVLFPAVRVSPGRHRIELAYRTPGLRAGAAISGGAWLLWGAAMVLIPYVRARLK